jgi:chemotaxis protein methyltransferase CheR
VERLSERLFQQFSALVYEECGINLHEGKKSLLEARLAKRLRATGMASPKEYYKYILSEDGRDELIRFFDAVSTNLTYFFREPKHFDFLVTRALPEMVRRSREQGSSRIRIWSAGCSTGEEPYTIAMSVLENLDQPDRWDFRILATDISTRVLQTAQRGIYDKAKLQNVPPALRSRYFILRRGGAGEKLYEVAPQLRKVIAFRRLNLKDPYPFRGPFDVIFCRNVMIYFDKKTQEMLIKKMAEYLVSGGYFFVGHSESLTGLDHPLKYFKPAVYQK